MTRLIVEALQEDRQGRGARRPQLLRATCYIQPILAGPTRPAGEWRVSEVALSPILVRPVREKLEHDRVIRLFQAKYKKKYDVGINVGGGQVAPGGTGNSAIFPDLVLPS